MTNCCKNFWICAIITNTYAARDFLAMKVAEGRMISESHDAMISNFTSNRSSTGRKKKKALAGQGGGGMSKQGRRQGKTKKIKF